MADFLKKNLNQNDGIFQLELNNSVAKKVSDFILTTLFQIIKMMMTRFQF